MIFSNSEKLYHGKNVKHKYLELKNKFEIYILDEFSIVSKHL